MNAQVFTFFNEDEVVDVISHSENQIVLKMLKEDGFFESEEDIVIIESVKENIKNILLTENLIEFPLVEVDINGEEIIIHIKESNHNQ